jgi:hypothetical protein
VGGAERQREQREPWEIAGIDPVGSRQSEDDRTVPGVDDEDRAGGPDQEHEADPVAESWRTKHWYPRNQRLPGAQTHAKLKKVGRSFVGQTSKHAICLHPRSFFW